MKMIRGMCREEQMGFLDR